MQYPVNLLAGQRPAAKRQFGDQRPLETVVEVERLFVIAAMVGQNCQRQLGRATAAIAPFESGRPVIPQVVPGIEPAAIYRDDDGIAFTASLILLLVFVAMTVWHNSPFCVGRGPTQGEAAPISSLREAIPWSNFYRPR